MTISSAVNTFECLLDVDSFLGTGLKVGDVAFGLAERGCPLSGNLSFVSSVSCLPCVITTYSTLVFLEIDLVA